MSGPNKEYGKTAGPVEAQCLSLVLTGPIADASERCHREHLRALCDDGAGSVGVEDLIMQR